MPDGILGATVTPAVPTTEIVVTERVCFSLPIPRFTDDEFFDFCVAHPELRTERTATGKIFVAGARGGRSGNRSAILSAELANWTGQDRRGVAFGSGTMFRLPDSSMRSPDASWVLRERLRTFADRQKERFLPLCPDFVIELTSPSDELTEGQSKMESWIANGCSLGWLIDPFSRQAFSYRPGAAPQSLEHPAHLLGEGPVEGFRLELAAIWDPGW